MSDLYPSVSLAGQVVLITGASSGIGEACAWRFAEAQSRLVLVARRTERLEALKTELTQKYSVEVHCITMDVQDTDRLTGILNELPDGFKEVDILVNNAGLALGVSGVQDNDMKDVRAMVETNVVATIALTKVVAKQMEARKSGHIVNISSIAGHEAYSGGSIYCATKFAIDAFTTAARHDLVGTPIRVTAISPGAVKTEFSNVRFRGDNDRADAVYKGIVPLVGADIADNVLYACTRPSHVQIADIVVLATLQSSAKGLARVLDN